MRFVRCRTTSTYDAMILTPEQAYAVLLNLEEPERTLTLLAAGTGLRISECLGLQWQDVSFVDAMIHVRRTWTCGQIGVPKSKASKGPVPLHPFLAEFMLLWKRKTPYPQTTDWGVSFIPIRGQATARRQHACRRSFATSCCKGWNPSSHQDVRGNLVDDDPRRFGFHNFAPQSRVVSDTHQN
jgi:integrase